MGTTKQIAIFGCGGHGKVVADIALANGYAEVVWIDDDRSKTEAMTLEQFCEKNMDVPVALGIGDNESRRHIYQRLKKIGITPEILVHPSAVISKRASIAEGAVVMPLAVVNADVTVGEGVIINSAAVIEHDCTIGAFSHISPKAALGGGVEVGSQTHIGIGSSIVEGVHIGSGAMIAAGSAVTADVIDHVMVAGVPAVQKKRLL